MDREEKLASKVRTQAKQLAELSAQLRESRSYAELVEQRLTDVLPKHPLPVQPHMLGKPAEPFRSPSNSRAGVAPSSSLAAAQAKVSELSSQLRAARTRAARAEKEASAATRRADTLAEKNAALTAKLGRYSPPARAGTARPSASQVASLQAEVAAAQAAHARAASDLAREAQAAEEARTYIAVLEHALRTGTGMPAHAKRPAAMAGAGSSRSRLPVPVAQAEAQAGGTAVSNAHRVAVESLETQLREAQGTIAQLRARLAGQGGAGAASPDEDAGEAGAWPAERAALLDYIREHQEKESALQTQLDEAQQQARDASAAAEAAQAAQKAAEDKAAAAESQARSAGEALGAAEARANHAERALRETQGSGEDAAAALASKALELEEAGAESLGDLFARLGGVAHEAEVVAQRVAEALLAQTTLREPAGFSLLLVRKT